MEIHSSAPCSVLVADDGESAAGLRAHLASSRVVVTHCSVADGIAMTERHPFQVIVSHWNDGWRQWLDGHAPAPLFIHVGSPPPDAMLVDVARGIDAIWCRGPMEVASVIGRMVGQRRTCARWSTGSQLRIDPADPDAVAGRVLDCSSEGIAFLVPYDTPLARLPIGSIMQGATIRRGEHRAMEDVDLGISNISAVDDGYRVGCTFIRRPSDKVDSGRTRIEQPTKIAALMLAASRQAGIRVAWRGSGMTQLIRDAAIDWASTAMTAKLPIGVDRAPDVVDGRFEIGHTGYRFTSATRGASSLSIRLPALLEGCERRAAARRPSPSGTRLRFVNAFSGHEAIVAVTELSAVGLSFDVQDGSPLPVGLRLGQALLEFADGSRFAVLPVVRSLERVDEATVHCGVSLDFHRPGDQQRYAEFVVRCAFPAAAPAEDAGFNAVFSLLGKMRAVPAGVSEDDVRRGFETLRHAPSDIHRRLVIEGEDGLIAHFCALRRYSGTWTLQHLASTSHDGHTTWGLMAAMVELCRQQPDTHFVHANYALANAFSARAIGSVVAGIAGCGRWNLAHRSMAVIEGIPAAVSGERVVVRQATTFDELRAGERIIAQWEPPLLLAANDWQATTLPMGTLAEHYRRNRLLRRRGLFIAEYDGRPVGFAIAELSDVGLNLREDMSAARMWVARDAQVPAAPVEQALLATVGRHYANQGRAAWPLIADPRTSLPLPLPGAHKPVRFVEVTVRRDASATMSGMWEHLVRQRRMEPAMPAATPARRVATMGAVHE